MIFISKHHPKCYSYFHLNISAPAGGWGRWTGSWTMTWTDGKTETYVISSTGEVSIGDKKFGGLKPSGNIWFPATEGWWMWTWNAWTYYIRFYNGNLYVHKFSTDRSCTKAYKNNMGSQYCGEGTSDTSDSTDSTDAVPLPLCPTFVQGDGEDENGSTDNEITVGTFDNPEDCIKACHDKNDDGSFNGVTIRQDNKCRCKRTAVAVDGDDRYKTCIFGKSR